MPEVNASNHVHPIERDVERSVSLVLRSKAASRLLRGRPRSEEKPAIIGLFGVADRLRIIWTRANAGDPFARWWLLRIEAATGTADARLALGLAEAEALLSEHKALCLNAEAGRETECVLLAFACPYAYWMARLIAALDRLIVTLDLAVTLGALRRGNAARRRHEAERTLRAAFASALGYHDLGITENRSSDNAAFDVATKMMGELPAEVARGERWPVLLETDGSHES